MQTPHSLIKETIEIHAPLDTVWSVFTDPDITRKMWGYYDTDWKIGSPFGFTNTDGKRLTHGTVLDFEPMHLIRHSLFEADHQTIMSIVSYTFQEQDGITTLIGTEKLTQTVDTASYEEYTAGWIAALNAVKQIAEML